MLFVLDLGRHHCLGYLTAVHHQKLVAGQFQVVLVVLFQGFDSDAQLEGGRFFIVACHLFSIGMGRDRCRAS